MQHRAMDQLQGMKVFVQVAQHASFATAARNLRLSAPAVSKHVASLEARIGTRLFDRTTRRVGLTEAGRVYLERCLECLQSLEEADASVRELANDPTGLLRVTAPIDFGEHLVPVVADVMNANPGVVVDLKLTNRVIDLVEEGVDAAVRVARSLDGQFVARPIARTQLAIFGSPEYLNRRGRPRAPEDLAAHRSLVFAEPRAMDELLLAKGRREVRVHRGVGLAVQPSFVAGRDLAAETIEHVLPEWTLPELRVFVIYPHRRFLSPKVRVFVEALRAAFGDGARDPWWPDAPRAVGRSRARGRKRAA
jgi:DNA-binding transcriptional LysR family regulator